MYNAYEIGEDKLIDFISDDKYFKCIKEYFESDSCPMSIIIIKNNCIYNYYLYKTNYIDTIKKYINNNNLENNYNILSNSISINKLKEILNNRDFTLKINNSYINISFNLIFKVLEYSDEEFNNFFKTNDNYNGLSKNLVLYMISSPTTNSCMFEK